MESAEICIVLLKCYFCLFRAKGACISLPSVARCFGRVQVPSRLSVTRRWCVYSTYLAHCGYIRRPLVPWRRTERIASFNRVSVGSDMRRWGARLLACPVPYCDVSRLTSPPPPLYAIAAIVGGALLGALCFCSVVANSEARVAGRRGDEGSRQKDGAPSEQNIYTFCLPSPTVRFFFRFCGACWCHHSLVQQYVARFFFCSLCFCSY